MSENGAEKSQKSPAEVSSLLDQTTNALKNLKASVDKPISNVDLNAQINAAAVAMESAKKYVVGKTSAAAEALREELKYLPDTLNALPDAVKQTSAKNIETLEASRKSIFETVTTATKTGFNRTVDAVATGMEKVGEFLSKIWDGMKPTLKRFVDMPMFAYFMGPDTLKTLKAALGYDEEMEAVEKDIRERLPDTVKFSLTLKKELTMFKDVYDKMLQKTNKSPEKYSRGAFIHDILGTYVKLEGKKEISMLEIVAGGKKLVEETKEVTPPPTPASATPAK